MFLLFPFSQVAFASPPLIPLSQGRGGGVPIRFVVSSLSPSPLGEGFRVRHRTKKILPLENQL